MNVRFVAPSSGLRRLGAGALAMAAVAAAALVGAGAAGAEPGTPGCNLDPNGDFTHTIPTVPGPPQISAFGTNGFVAAAMTGSDTKVYDYGIDATTDPLGVTPLFCEGGGALDAPYIAGSADGSLQRVFALGAGKIIYYRTFTTTSASGWLRVPNSFAGSGPVAVVTPTRTDIFYISGFAPNNIYHHVFHDGRWFGPEKLPGAGLGRVSGYQLPNGSFRLWLTGTNHSIYTMSGNTGHWSGWKKLSSGASLRAVSGTIGFDPTTSREDVFAVGTSGGLFEGTFTRNFTTFSGWRRITSDIPNNSDVSAAAAGPGRMMVYMKVGSTGPIIYDQYLNGHWGGLFLAPYACPDCAPTPPAAAAAATSGARGKATARAPKVNGGVVGR
jgi:hypothetical protein